MHYITKIGLWPFYIKLIVWSIPVEDWWVCWTLNNMGCIRIWITNDINTTYFYFRWMRSWYWFVQWQYR